jgi:hypothetical protein
MRENVGRQLMIKARKCLTVGLIAATFAAGIAAATPALARGRGGWGHGGYGHVGWGGGGYRRVGWGGGWGYGGYGGGWGYPGWGYGGYDYGVDLAGAALGAVAVGAIAAGAAQQNPYYYGSGYPVAQYNYGSVRRARYRTGRTCIRTEWDALEGYVQVRAPC